MNARERPRVRLRWLPVAGIALGILTVCVLGSARPWSAPPAPVAAAENPTLTPSAVTLPDDPTVLVFGDSWVYGSAAIQPTLGFAYLTGTALGWNAVVDGVRGSGYLKPGIDGPAYGERIAALDPTLAPDLIIVEGSINDRRLPAAGYRDAVDAAWDALVDRYPDASIVILGPAPQVLPVESATARIDRDLAGLASARGWWYISPLAEGWITAANYPTVIDTSDIGRDHPSTEGHAYLAQRLAAALDQISGTPVVVADGPGPAT